MVKLLLQVYIPACYLPNREGSKYMVKLLLQVYIHLPVTNPIGQCLQSVVPRMPSHVLLVYRYIATGKEYIVQLYSTNSLNSVMQYHPPTNTKNYTNSVTHAILTCMGIPEHSHTLAHHTCIYMHGQYFIWLHQRHACTHRKMQFISFRYQIHNCTRALASPEQ